MTTEPTPAATPAVIPGNVPQPLAGNTTPPEPLAGDGQEQISLDEARKLRKENQTLRNRQKTIDDAEALRQQAAMSDLEKATKAHADMEAKYQQTQELLIAEKVQNAAHKRGIIDPEMAALAIGSKLEKDENGMPTNIDKALDELIKNKPYLVPKNDAQPATPAQTNTPALPAMNPGRSSIQSPTGNIPGVRRRLSEFL
jgi:hypothetical protein